MHPLELLGPSAACTAAARDHFRRLSPQGPLDEINRLAHTINGMLQALEDAYQQVQDAYQQVQKVNDLQRHFMIDVAHELRTPLIILLSSPDVIRREGARELDFQAHFLEQMRAEDERMR